MKLLKPVLGRLTQGVVFSCAIAEDYDDNAVYGLVVTARCDIAQDKFPLVSYLPIVTLDAWMRRDGHELLHARAMADADGKIRGLLTSVGLSSSLLIAHTPRQILDTIFEPSAADTKYVKARAKAREIVQHFESVAACQSAPTHSRKLYALADGLRRGLLKELALNRLTGYYFLPSAVEGDPESGFVVLLRQLKSLPRRYAMAVSRGLDRADPILNDLRWTGSLSFEHETFAMPLAEVPSPEIEHILQTFSILYGRIGVEDLPQSYVDTICARTIAEIAQ